MVTSDPATAFTGASALMYGGPGRNKIKINRNTNIIVYNPLIIPGFITNKSLLNN